MTLVGTAARSNLLATSARSALLGGVALVTLSSPAWAAPDQVDLGSVQATGGQIGAAPANSAIYQAPTKTPLTATQPTSVIGQQYIQNNVAPSANYNDVVRIAPSVSSVDPNGPGLMEGQGLNIRGFKDGQYNVTFDGIPWADSNNFTHHTTSYFMAHDLGQASVDRGPGTASTVGDATFGGTIALQSKDPLQKMTLTPYATVGSYETHLFGGEFDTGPIASMNGASAFVDVEGLKSNGYLTNSDQDRFNVFLKAIQPIGNNTVLTAVVMHDRIQQNVPLGETRAQIATFGPNYGLSNDPTKQNFKDYNVDHIQTDFEYLGLRSLLGDGWSVDNKVYTYGYYHHGDNGEDVNGNTPNGTFYGKNDVPGQRMRADYRAFGDVLRLQKETSFGAVRAGAWVEHQAFSRQQYEVDWTLGGALNPPNSKATDRLMQGDLLSLQPYFEFDWRVTPALTITPGIKYNFFARDLNAPVNQGTKTPLYYSKDYGAAVPSIAAHYAINPNWAAYAQVAKGYLAPDLAYFYTNNPASSSPSPQETVNYQVGTSWQTHRLSLSGDVYYIDFDNMIGSVNIGNNTVYFNQGGVNYYGVEAEGTVYLDHGISLYANGSINQARSKQNNLWIPNTPAQTAALGIIYNQDGIYASLIDKWVGSRFGDNNEKQGLDPYNQLDLSLGYTLQNQPKGVPPVSVKLQISNLLDSRNIYDFYGYAADGKTAKYFTQPGRSFFLSASAPF
jgi:iron complex outermembrane receptor protein